MPRRRTKTLAPKLSEVARHVVLPAGIVTTGWPQIRDQILLLGIVFDLWQDGLGRAIFGKRKDGKYAATVGGVVLSIPRQVGKTYVVGAILFALCILFPGTTVLWTAHRTRTSGETFRAMQGMARRAKIKPHVLHVHRGAGKEEVEFVNGSRILFGAREMGFGRGFANVDVIVFDEAQILSTKALDDMVAATNQPTHPHGALLFYMGTPPRPGDPSEAFATKRRKALSGKAKNVLFVEMSADKGADPDDRRQWAKANPSYPLRTPVESMMRLRENLPDVDSFMREGLGIWDDDEGGGFFTPGAWTPGIDKRSKITDRLALGLAVSPDRKRATIGAAGTNAKGRRHLEPITAQAGTAWIVKEAKRLQGVHGPLALALDAGGPASDLVPKLEAAGVRVYAMSTDEFKVACSEIVDRVDEGGHAHLDDARLNGAVYSAEQRTIGDRFVIKRRGPSDVTPLEAVVLASWLSEHYTPPREPLAAFA